MPSADARSSRSLAGLYEATHWHGADSRKGPVPSNLFRIPPAREGRTPGKARRDPRGSAACLARSMTAMRCTLAENLWPTPNTRLSGSDRNRCTAVKTALPGGGPISYEAKESIVWGVASPVPMAGPYCVWARPWHTAERRAEQPVTSPGLARREARGATLLAAPRTTVSRG